MTIQEIINNFVTPSFGDEKKWRQLFVALLASFIFLIIPILVAIIFPFIKKGKLSEKGTVIIYTFSTGFFITLSLFGFLREALEGSTLELNNYNYPDWKVYVINALIVGGGLSFGISLAFLIKWIIKISAVSKVKKDPHASQLIHSHDFGEEHVEHYHIDKHTHTRECEKQAKSSKRMKAIALFLLLTHRVPAGLVIGYSLNSLFDTISKTSSVINLAFLISFILHLIPEEIIFFYRLKSMGMSNSKSTILSISSLLILVPLIIIGIYAGAPLYETKFVKSIVWASVSGIFLFTSIVEFLPEVLNMKYDKKMVTYILISFFVAIIICSIILSFHKH
ncbi:ZIP family metal transporter [Mycoplasmopsis opalescens]|uniref:ZIP family metal transporter n=1 Tax=Mycoplasmopsis opalescens TaxID=114886 RepID=UPI0004A778E9|nr:ZIP family metal transporter [Mycoplasmopsis opalescens]